MHTLPNLPYAYNALEPHIDEATMKLHHTKHHQTYVDKLNAALEPYPELQQKTLEDLLTSLETLPAEIKTAVRNHGGGHYNHSLFWEMLAPIGGAEKPIGDLATAIDQVFGNFEEFKKAFTTSATAVFGSGWTWLVIDENKKLAIVNTGMQDNPISKNQKPLLGLDVWEHAYYLKYQNRRAEYIENFWKIINWGKIEDTYGRSK